MLQQQDSNSLAASSSVATTIESKVLCKSQLNESMSSSTDENNANNKDQQRLALSSNGRSSCSASFYKNRYVISDTLSHNSDESNRPSSSLSSSYRKNVISDTLTHNSDESSVSNVTQHIQLSGRERQPKSKLLELFMVSPSVPKPSLKHKKNILLHQLTGIANSRFGDVDNNNVNNTNHNQHTANNNDNTEQDMPDEEKDDCVVTATLLMISDASNAKDETPVMQLQRYRLSQIWSYTPYVPGVFNSLIELCI